MADNLRPPGEDLDDPIDAPVLPPVSGVVHQPDFVPPDALLASVTSAPPIGVISGWILSDIKNLSLYFLIYF